MGKLLSIYNEVTSRIDTAISSGTLTYFNHHYKGIPLDEQINNENSCPFIITTIEDTADNIPNNIRETSIELPIVTYIKTRKATNDNVYEDSSGAKGIIRDVEKVIDVVNSDCNMNNTADIVPTYSISFSKVGTDYVLATIRWTIISKPFRFGTLSS